MSQFEIKEDRREQRSEETLQALTYQLEHVVDEFDMDLMVLADHQGTVVTAAGAQHLATIIAARCRDIVSASDRDKVITSIIPDLDPAHVVCEELSLEDLPLYLCAIMEPDDTARSGFDRARTGIKRIYDTTSDFLDES